MGYLPHWRLEKTRLRAFWRVVFLDFWGKSGSLGLSRVTVVGGGQPVREGIITYIDYTKHCYTKQCHSCLETLILRCCTTSN